MRNHGNMGGFNSLSALYLFEKGEKLECLANKLEEKNKNIMMNITKKLVILNMKLLKKK